MRLVESMTVNVHWSCIINIDRLLKFNSQREQIKN